MIEKECPFQNECGFIKYIAKRRGVSPDQISTCGKEDPSMCSRLGIQGWVPLEMVRPQGDSEMRLAHPSWRESINQSEILEPEL